MNNVVFANQSAAEFVALLLVTFFVLSCVVGWVLIYRKAGFTGLWAIPPAVSGGAYLILLYLLFFDVQTVQVGGLVFHTRPTVSDFSALFWIFVLTFLVSWVEFLVFAVIQWPVIPVAAPRASSGPALAPLAVAVPAMAAAGPATTTAAAVAPVVQSAVPEVTTFYCSWCGKERRRDAFAIHHCGSRERPPAFCSSCGSAIAEGDEACGTCATPTSKLSPV